MRSTDQIEGLPVISIKEGKNLGRVSQCVVDLARGEVVGLLVRAEGEDEDWGLTAPDIQVLGQDAVMVESEQIKKPVSPRSRLLKFRREPEAPPADVVTDEGERLGTLGQVYVDTAKLQVIGYEVTGSALRTVLDGTPHIPIIKGVVHGADTVIVPTTAKEHLQAGTGGLRSYWAKLAGLSRDAWDRASDAAATGLDKAKTARKPAAKKAASTEARGDDATPADSPAADQPAASGAEEKAE